jgi:hypothetical protein
MAWRRAALLVFAAKASAGMRVQIGRYEEKICTIRIRVL